MVRTVLMGIGLSCVCLAPCFAGAQDQPRLAAPKRQTFSREERPRVANTEYLIYQRAAYIARRRVDHLESLKAQGLSPQRPEVRYESYSTSGFTPRNYWYGVGW